MTNQADGSGERPFEGRLRFVGLIWRNDAGYWRRFVVRQYDLSRRYQVNELVMISLERARKLP